VDRNEVRAIILKAIDEGLLDKGTMKNQEGKLLTFYYFKNNNNT
jgi:hypothetical protein